MKTTLLTILSAVLLMPAFTGCVSPSSRSSSLISDKIYSDALCEERAYCVYLPENFDPEQRYPVIFATDGQIIESGKYKTLLDNLIEEGRIPAVVLIGTNSNEQTVSNGMELRYYEYIENDNKNPGIAGRFENHFKFFSEEIRNKVFTKYGIRPDPSRYIFYGCSNGGDYGLTIYAKHPKLFSGYICLSPVGTEAETFDPETTAAELYVAFGNDEAAAPYGGGLTELENKLDSIGSDHVTIHVYTGGHDRKCWEQEFVTALPLVLKEQGK